LTYKQHYYLEKFNIPPEELSEFKEKIKLSYVEGLIWNFNYYYRGCISWGWFYPFHYSPMVSDLSNIEFEVKFELGTPFRPID
jgi:5'-3' exoribonuclease 2